MSDTVVAALLALLTLSLFGPSDSLAGQQSSSIAAWPEKFFNPQPSPDDLVLPMACGGAMVFRAVEIPSVSRLDDRRVELGQANEERGFKEGRRLSYLAGAFSAADDGSAARRYYIAKYETTRDQYAVFFEDACPQPSMRGRLPATDVTWFDAVDFSRRYTEWLLQNAREHLPIEGQELGFLRLPTEVEWEFAARGGLKVDEADFLAPLFPMPDGDLAQYVWYESTQSAEGQLRPVGLLRPNSLELYDVLGNAAEMTFLPFHLDHRGRAHGQTGGFVTRGGDIFTPPSQIGTAVRQEHSYFSGVTGAAKRLDSLGFRLVLTAPVIVSPERLSEIKQAWSILPALQGDLGEQATQALDALRAVATSSADAKLRAQLELIRHNVEQTHTAINEARLRTLRGLIRTGAFMARRVATDKIKGLAVQRAITAARAKIEALRERIEGRTGAQPILDELISKTKEKIGKWDQMLAAADESLMQSLAYYGETVIGVGTDYTQSDLEHQLKVVESELRLRKNTYLLPYARLFVTHSKEFKQMGIADKADWLTQILAIETNGDIVDETD